MGTIDEWSYIELNVDRGFENIFSSQKNAVKKLSNVIFHFFKRGPGSFLYQYKDMDINARNFPFKGFLLEGIPGTGKTEIVIYAAKKVKEELKNENIRVDLIHINAANIAAKGWGDAEKRLRDIFNRELKKDERLIILFDDLESLFIGRESDLAKEWHYAINSIFFHEIDKLKSDQMLICATTNKPELVDDAISTRLYNLVIPPPKIEELRPYIATLIPDDLNELVNKTMDILGEKQRIYDKEKDDRQITIREARQEAVLVYIDYLIDSGY